MRISSSGSVVVLSMMLALPAIGYAKGPAPAKGAAVGLSNEEIAVMLSSPELNEVRMALEAASTTPRATLTPLLTDRVRAGLRADLLLLAIDAVAASGGPDADALLRELARHRRPEVRTRVLLTLASKRAPDAEAVLVTGLSDRVEEVRKAAVTGLGMGDAKAAVPALLLALTRDVEGADTTIVEVADANVVRSVADQLGQLPFSKITGLLDGLLFKRGLADEAKLGLLTRIAALDSLDARSYVAGLAARLPADASTQLKKSLTSLTARSTP